MAIATAPRGRSNAALTAIRQVFSAIAGAVIVSFEIYCEAMERRAAYYARNPHLSED
jgi:hypothetical protein